MILIFDSETTGLPLWREPSDDPRQPHIVDLACSLFDNTGAEVERYDTIINPGVEIPDDVARLHGITTEIAREQGEQPDVALVNFMALYRQADLVVGHNVSFDIRMVRILSARVTGEKWDCDLPTFCTMRRTTNICKIPSANQRHPKDWKWPRLTEATKHLFGDELADAHRARPDCDAAARIYFHLIEKDLAA